MPPAAVGGAGTRSDVLGGRVTPAVAGAAVAGADAGVRLDVEGGSVVPDGAAAVAGADAGTRPDVEAGKVTPATRQQSRWSSVDRGVAVWALS